MGSCVGRTIRLSRMLDWLPICYGRRLPAQSFFLPAAGMIGF
jgi:hypothetical protein